jgi:hypothetical protein
MTDFVSLLKKADVQKGGTYRSPPIPSNGHPQIDIHASIRSKLRYFYENRKIPHILFHGPHGSGKKTILKEFLDMVYEGKSKLKHLNILHSNCSHSKGIKHIREILKEYARSNVAAVEEGVYFKSVILYNFEDLSVDAQSALRRVIESYSSTTRFFLVSHGKENILTPILSRLAHIYIPLPIINGAPTNLHTFHIQQRLRILSGDSEEGQASKDLKEESLFWLQGVLCKDCAEGASSEKDGCQIHATGKGGTTSTLKYLVALSEKMYDDGRSSFDLVQWIRESGHMDDLEFCTFHVLFCKVRSELMHEKTLILFCFICCMHIRSHTAFQNIFFL